MPLTIRLLGYELENASDRGVKRDVADVLEDVSDHTDETLASTLREVLEGHPAIIVWCLTYLDGGTASVFEKASPTAILHRITADGDAMTTVQFPWDGQGFVQIAVSSIPKRLLDSHPSFADDLDVTERLAHVTLPTSFADDAELAHVLDEVARVASSHVKTCAVVASRFVGIELGPGRSRVVPLAPSAASSAGTTIARRIVDGA